MSIVLIKDGLDAMVPSGIHSTDSDETIITKLKSNQLYNKVIQQFYNIKKNVEYRSVGKHSYYNLIPNYASDGDRTKINCNLSVYYMSYFHKHNTLFTRVVQLAIRFISEVKRNHNGRSLGLYYPTCGILSKRCN